MTDLIIGTAITGVRALTPAEHGWPPPSFPVFALELDNGVVVYASQDATAETPGVLLGRNPQGQEFVIVSRKDD